MELILSNRSGIKVQTQSPLAILNWLVTEATKFKIVHGRGNCITKVAGRLRKMNYYPDDSQAKPFHHLIFSSKEATELYGHRNCHFQC